MPRIDPTAHQALYRLQREERRQAEWLPCASGTRRRRDEWKPSADLLAEAKRLIEAIEKLL